MTNDTLAERLMEMAARRSVETPLGWAHPDCEVLVDAAHALLHEPQPIEPAIVDGVLAECARLIAADQQPLGAEFERVWNDNIDKLYQD